MSDALVAPLGFLEDGSTYCVVTPTAPTAGSVQSELIAWIRAMAL